MGKARRLRSSGCGHPGAVPRAHCPAVLADDPHGLGWLWAGLLAAGAAIGWQRGRSMNIAVDPETHALNQSLTLAMLP